MKLRHGSYYYGQPEYQAKTLSGSVETFQTRYYCENTEVSPLSELCRDCNSQTKYMLYVYVDSIFPLYFLCTNCAPVNTFEKTHSSYQSS